MHINKNDAALVSYFLTILEEANCEIGDDRRKVLSRLLDKFNAASIDYRAFNNKEDMCRKSEKVPRGRKIKENGLKDIRYLIEKECGKKVWMPSDKLISF